MNDTGLAILIECRVPLAVMAVLEEDEPISDTIWIVVFAIGLVISIAVAVILAKVVPPPPRVPRPRRAVAHPVGFYFFYIVSLVGLMGLAVALGAFGFGGILGFFFAGLMVRYFLVSRQGMATQVFSTLGACMRQNLPLPDALLAETTVLRGQRQRVFARMAAALADGHPLSEAIRRGYPQCPGFAVAAIAAAERVDQVPRAIATIEAYLDRQAHQARKLTPVHPVYPVVLVFFALSVLATLVIFVLPKFQAILEDAGGSVPAATHVLTHLSEPLSVLLSVPLGVFALIVVPVAIYTAFRPRRPERPYWLSRVGDTVKWKLPILHRFERSHSLLHVVSFLRLGLDAGATVDRAIAAAAELDVNGRFRKRLRAWLARVQQGEDVAAAARGSGVGSALAWAFDQQVNPGNTPAILASLESFYRGRYGYARNVARNIFWPLAIGLLAALVGYVVYALYAPLVALNEFMVQTTIP